MKDAIIALSILLFLWAVFDVLSSGRYQLVQGEITYLVDTKTGRVWERNKKYANDKFVPLAIFNVGNVTVPDWEPER